MTVLLLITAAWVAVLALTLSVLMTAKRADEAMARELGRPSRRLAARPPDGPLADVAAEVQRAVGAERVAVVVVDPGEPATGRVGACCGAPGLVGRRVRIAPTRTTGVVRPADAAGLGLAVADEGPWPWTFAHLPLPGEGRLVGAVTVASRSRAFTDDDLTVIERIARSRGRPFDRRRRPR